MERDKMLVDVLCMAVWWVIAICGLIKFGEFVEILRNGWVIKVDEKVRMTGQLVEDKDDTISK